MSEFMSITAYGSGDPVGARSVTPELAEELVDIGVAPSTLNRIDWPVAGATRWATARLLMHTDDLDELLSQMTDGGLSGPDLFCTLQFGSVLFPQMVVGRARPLLVTEATKSMLLVEFHCRRWLWRRWRAMSSLGAENFDQAVGFNMTGVHRGRFARLSLHAATDALWSGKEIVEHVRSAAGTSPHDNIYWSSTDGWDDAAATSYYSSATAVNDVSAEDTVPGIIDKVLARTGNVLLVTPKQTGDGLDFQVRAVDDQSSALAFYSARRNDLQAGGLDFIEDGATVPTGGASYAYGAQDATLRDCPDLVRVYFPFSVADGMDNVLAECARADCDGADGGTDPTVAASRSTGYLTWDTDTGRPAFATSGGAPTYQHILDDFPMVTSADAAAGDVVDTSLLSARAEQASTVFYSRFLAGCGDAFFRGWLAPLAASVWSGAQWWEIGFRRSAGDLVPFTRVWGERDCQLYGYQPMAMPLEVQGVGNAQAFRGPDGSLRVVAQQLGGIPVRIRIKAILGEVAANRWRYSAVLLRYAGDDEWEETSVTFDAWNAVERRNTSTFAGPSKKLPLSVGGTFDVLPIGQDRDGDFHEVDVDAFIYENRNAVGGKTVEFSLSNDIDGSCPA